MRKSPGSLALVLAGTVALAGCTSPMGRIALREGHRVDPALLAVPANPDLVSGKQALSAGNYGAAIAALRLARLDPASAAEATNGLAVAYAGIGRDDLAERYFRQAVAMAPDDRRFAANLARFTQDRETQLAAAEPPAPPPAPVVPQLKAGLHVAAAGGNKTITVSGAPVAAQRPATAAAPRIAVVAPPPVKVVRVTPGQPELAAAGPVKAGPVKAGAPARLTVLAPRPALVAAPPRMALATLGWRPVINRAVRDVGEFD
ncbi:MAG: hypothetical protein O9283_08945 [Sphingomonadaceae bacterium]|nr:hypothetical protein [Sphingomonadaceae bacterium]